MVLDRAERAGQHTATSGIADPRKEAGGMPRDPVSAMEIEGKKAVTTGSYQSDTYYF